MGNQKVGGNIYKAGSFFCKVGRVFLPGGNFFTGGKKRAGTGSFFWRHNFLAV